MNFFILLTLLLISPKILFERLFKGKKHPAFLQRIGLSIPLTQKPTIWIHAVSVGEIKSAQSLLRQLKAKYPNAFFLITTTTATGHEEAKRSLSQANAFAYLPFDLSWVVRRWVKKIDPALFILIESDFWFQLLSALKKNGTPTFLVSGKISEKSARRFALFPTFSKRLFSLFDQICVQNTLYQQRFLPLVPDPTRLHITGNLKLDIEPQPVQRIPYLHPLITISCTHAPEEDLLLAQLLNGAWSILLAPRHPERFEEVAQLLLKKNIPFSRWSQGLKLSKVTLIDTMGQLPFCYAHSQLAILGGSYIPQIGGHNLLEPCLYGTPVLFGPYIHNQTELAQRVQESGAGLCVPLNQLRATVTHHFQDPAQAQKMKIATHNLIQSGRGVVEKTLNILNKLSINLTP